MPQNEKGEITDDIRITSALPTIQYLLDQGSAVILMSHLGRPSGEVDMAFTLAPVAERLSSLLNRPVKFLSVPEVVNQEVKAAATELKAGEVMLLENVRFRTEETKNVTSFSEELASLAEIYVNDAFGTAHRAHCSTTGIADYLPAVSGFLMEKEVQFLGNAVEHPKRPFLAILGGAKVSDKIPVIENLLDKVDSLIIGGGMAFTFLKAQGFEVGKSKLEAEMMEMAQGLLAKARAQHVDLRLPVDVKAATEFKNEAVAGVFPIDQIPADCMGLDIGEQSVNAFTELIREAKTIVWNGPMGVFEMPNFADGTKAVAKALADSDAVTIIGGGDSAAAVQQFGYADRMTHISTGGGASLEYLEGKVLPGVAALLDKK